MIQAPLEERWSGLQTFHQRRLSHVGLSKQHHAEAILRLRLSGSTVGDVSQQSSWITGLSVHLLVICESLIQSSTQKSQRSESPQAKGQGDKAVLVEIQADQIGKTFHLTPVGQRLKQIVVQVQYPQTGSMLHSGRKIAQITPR